jgi:hypothetical protein
MVIGEEGRSSSFKFFLIQNLKLLLFPHSRSFAFIRGSEILKDSALRGRIALPGKGEKQKAESRKLKKRKTEVGGRRPGKEEEKEVSGQQSMVTGEDREDMACALAFQSLGQDAPRTDWDKMSQLREEVPRRMRGTAGGTPALPYEEAVSSLSLITNNE